ncbi:MAG: hypothetical protein ABWZ54_06210, partial [Luteibacter sp.]
MKTTLLTALAFALAASSVAATGLADRKDIAHGPSNAPGMSGRTGRPVRRRDQRQGHLALRPGLSTAGSPCGMCLWHVPWEVPVGSACGKCLWEVPVGSALAHEQV